jgi:nucleoside-diphosphate-sugar epimerase
METRKIIITGATGFVGSNLARYFVGKNSEVHVLLRSSSNMWRISDIMDDVIVHQGDLTSPSGLERVMTSVRPDIILHTAVYGGHPFQKDTNKIFNANLYGTINLVKACESLDYELFVNTGSSSEYGVKRRPMAETDVCEPGEDYGVSKTAASLYCQMAARRDQKSIITFRLFSPYGSYDDATRLIPSVIISCLNGRPPKVSSPFFVRDYIYIHDIISAYEKAIETSYQQSPGEIFNIGSGKQQNVGDFVQHIVQLVNKNIQPEWGSPGKRQNEPQVWQADIRKAESSLGWKPRYSIEQGLRDTVEWFSKNIGRYEGKRLL